MSKLTPQELADARSDFAECFLSSRCDILRSVVGTPSGYGGQVHTQKTIASDVPCKPQKARRPQVIEEGAQHVALADWEVLLPVGTDVSLGDEVHVGPDTYEVKGSDAGTDGAMCLIAYCTRDGK